MIIFKCTIINAYTAPQERGKIDIAYGNNKTMPKTGRRRQKYLANDSERNV